MCEVVREVAGVLPVPGVSVSKLPSAEELASAWTTRGKARTMLTEEIKEHVNAVLEAAADEVADCFEDEEDYLPVRAAILKLKEEL